MRPCADGRRPRARSETSVEGKTDFEPEPKTTRRGIASPTRQRRATGRPRPLLARTARRRREAPPGVRSNAGSGASVRGASLSSAAQPSAVFSYTMVHFSNDTVALPGRRGFPSSPCGGSSVFHPPHRHRKNHFTSHARRLLFPSARPVGIFQRRRFTPAARGFSSNHRSLPFGGVFSPSTGRGFSISGRHPSAAKPSRHRSRRNLAAVFPSARRGEAAGGRESTGSRWCLPSGAANRRLPATTSAFTARRSSFGGAAPFLFRRPPFPVHHAATSLSARFLNQRRSNQRQGQRHSFLLSLFRQLARERKV